MMYQTNHPVGFCPVCHGVLISVMAYKDPHKPNKPEVLIEYLGGDDALRCTNCSRTWKMDPKMSLMKLE